MNRIFSFTILILKLLISLPAYGQTDLDPPITPVFNLVSVQPLTGRTELHWTKSTSPDVAGYVLYNFRNNEGFAFDTIYDPDVTDYVNMGAFANDRIESYVIAAIDTAGNISPLSNELHTIFATLQIDTCNKKINLSWNRYSSAPVAVTGYRIMSSTDGSPYTDAGLTGPDMTTFSTGNFNTGLQYCFIVRAELAGGTYSLSNRVCVSVVMQRPPLWINADYASVNDDNSISLSYTVDPLSAISTYGLDRKRDTEAEFTRITVLQSSGNKVNYTDRTALAGRKYVYRLGAVNNCGNSVVFSGLSANMVPELSQAGNLVTLKWNSYREWEGGIDHYSVYINTGNGFTEKTVLSSGDTSLTMNYSDFMSDISAGKYCFRIEAYEGSNPHGISGQSRSGEICGETLENVTVPNAFSPDNDNINEKFRPVLTFTPSEYKFIITDRKNNRLFETSSYLEEWDGTRNGSALPPDVYLWFLRIRTPSGKYLNRTGTVTIIKGR